MSRSRTVAVVCTALLAVAMSGNPSSAAPRALPDDYVVSHDPGLATEGVALGPDGSIYVTSDATGRVFRGDIDSPELTPFPAAGTAERGTSLGIHTDGAGRIWSVGGASLTVHDRSGALLSRQSAPGGPLGPPDLNDLTLTPDAVYVTDWANPIVYRAERHGSRVGPLTPWLDMRSVIPGFPAQYWLLNGIVADRTGNVVLVSSNGTEAVWRVDVATRDVQTLDVGGASFGPDGMVLDGTTLYAVLNYGAPHGVYVAELDPTLSSGTIDHRLLADAHGDPFRLPTTLAVHGCRIYVVNYQTTTPEAPYLLSALGDPTCS